MIFSLILYLGSVFLRIKVENEGFVIHLITGEITKNRAMFELE